MDMGGFQQKEPKMPGAHKIGTAISGPRIAGGKIMDMRHLNFFGESKLQSRFSPDLFDFQIFSWKGRSIATRTQCDLVEQVLCKTGLHNKDKFLEVVHFVATYQRTPGH